MKYYQIANDWELAKMRGTAGKTAWNDLAH
jgi:hypothetical protein